MISKLCSNEREAKKGAGGLKPAAPSGRNRQAERRESQGALARLCEFPGSAAQKEVQMENMKENKMGVMPVKKLVVSMSLPMMVSMLVQALYNVVDSIFVAKVCEDALTAVSLSFSAQNLMIGVATGTGVGVNALLSRSLGAREFD